MVKQSDPREHAANQWLFYRGLFSLFLAICFLVLPFHAVGQIPLQIPLSTSPNPNTGRRAEYLLSGDGLAPRQRGGESATRVVEEVQALEDNLSTAVRHHAIANSKLRLTKGYLDVSYAELRLIGFSLLAAGDFVGLGATLAGIPGVIVIEDPIAAAVETTMTSSPNITTLQFNSDSFSSFDPEALSSQRYERIGNKNRRTQFSGAHRQSRGRRTGQLRNINSTRRALQREQRRIASQETFAFNSGEYHNTETSNFGSENSAEVSAVIAISLDAVALSLDGAGLLVIREGCRVSTVRAQINVQVATNDYVLAVYAAQVTRQLEVEYRRIAGGILRRKGDCHTVRLGVVCDKGPLLSPDPRRIFPDYFYGRWQSSASETRPIGAFWVLTSAFNSIFSFSNQDHSYFSSREIFMDDYSIRTFFQIRAESGQLLTVQNSDSVLQTRLVLKMNGDEAKRAPTLSASINQSKTNFTIDNLHTIGIFLGWETDEKPSWHWYSYNRVDGSLTDTKSNHRFVRIEE